MHFFAKFFELSIVLRSLSVRKKEINVVNGSKNIEYLRCPKNHYCRWGVVLSHGLPYIRT